MQLKTDSSKGNILQTCSPSISHNFSLILSVTQVASQTLLEKNTQYLIIINKNDMLIDILSIF